MFFFFHYKLFNTYWIYDRLKFKTGGSKNLAHTGWNWGRGYLRREKRITKGIPKKRLRDER
jgi:hypothetical protein